MFRQKLKLENIAFLKRKKKEMGRNKSDLKEKEKIGGEMRKYLCIYEESCSSFKERKKCRNARDVNLVKIRKVRFRGR